MYTRKENLRGNRNTKQFEVNRNINPNCNPSNSNGANQNWRSAPERSSKPHVRNPPDRYGILTKFAVCQSINHWAQNCPDRSTHDNNTHPQLI